MSETATLDIVIESEFVSETSGGDLDVFTVELYWRRAAELDWSILIGHWGYIWSATGKSKILKIISRAPIRRDPCNLRKNKRHQAAMVHSVCRLGVCYDARGRPWARWGRQGNPDVDDDTVDPMDSKFFALPVGMVAWGNLTTGVQIARRKFPRNKHIQTILRDGLRFLRIIYNRIPRPALKWLVLFHNSFNQVQEIGLDCILAEVSRLQGCFDAAKQKSGWTSYLATSW